LAAHETRRINRRRQGFRRRAARFGGQDGGQEDEGERLKLRQKVGFFHFRLLPSAFALLPGRPRTFPSFSLCKMSKSKGAYAPFTMA